MENFGNNYKPGAKPPKPTASVVKKPVAKQPVKKAQVRTKPYVKPYTRPYNKQQLEWDIIRKRNRLNIFLTFGLPAVALPLSVFLSIVMYVYVFKPIILKEWAKPLNGPLFWGMLVLVVACAISFIAIAKALKDEDGAGKIVGYSILLCGVIVGAPVVTAQFAAVCEMIWKFTIAYEDYWKIYVIPTAEFLIATIAYALLTIRKENEFGYKLQLSAGIAGFCGFAFTFITYMIFLSQHAWKFTTETSILRLLATISSLATYGILAFVAKWNAKDTEPAGTASRILWATGLSFGIVAAILGIVVIIIAIIIMIIAIAVMAGLANSAEQDQQYYNKKFKGTNIDLHENWDGTLTDRSGKSYKKVGYDTYQPV